MINTGGRQRAAIVLGATAVLRTVFVSFGGPFKLVRLNLGPMAVADLLLGAFAVVAGFSGHRGLILLAGALFLAGVVVSLVLLIVDTSGFLRVSVGGLSLWIGLGAGLAALGLTPNAIRRSLAEHIWRYATDLLNRLPFTWRQLQLVPSGST